MDIHQTLIFCTADSFRADAEQKVREVLANMSPDEIREELATLLGAYREVFRVPPAGSQPPATTVQQLEGFDHEQLVEAAVDFVRWLVGYWDNYDRAEEAWLQKAKEND